MLENFACCSCRDKFSKVSKNKTTCISFTSHKVYFTIFRKQYIYLFAPDDYGLTDQEINSLLYVAVEITKSSYVFRFNKYFLPGTELDLSTMKNFHLFALF